MTNQLVRSGPPPSHTGQAALWPSLTQPLQLLQFPGSDQRRNGLAMSSNQDGLAPFSASRTQTERWALASAIDTFLGIDDLRYGQNNHNHYTTRVATYCGPRVRRWITSSRRICRPCSAVNWTRCWSRTRLWPPRRQTGGTMMTRDHRTSRIETNALRLFPHAQRNPSGQISFRCP